MLLWLRLAAVVRQAHPNQGRGRRRKFPSHADGQDKHSYPASVSASVLHQLHSLVAPVDSSPPPRFMPVPTLCGHVSCSWAVQPHGNFPTDQDNNSERAKATKREREKKIERERLQTPTHLPFHLNSPVAPCCVPLCRSLQQQKRRRNSAGGNHTEVASAAPPSALSSADKGKKRCLCFLPRAAFARNISRRLRFPREWSAPQAEGATPQAPNFELVQ